MLCSLRALADMAIKRSLITRPCSKESNVQAHYMINYVQTFSIFQTVVLVITRSLNYQPHSFAMAANRCILNIKNAVFLKTASLTRTPQNVFTNPIKSFEILNKPTTPIAWGVLGPSKGEFLNVIAGKYVSQPGSARTYPSLNSAHGSLKIQYLNFRDNSGLDHAHVSARYESYSYKGVLEMSDDVNSVVNYVTGANNYNRAEQQSDVHLTERLLELFNLTAHKNKWINSLSNGQRRRARIAKALYTRPQLLVIDDPFLGLDPEATQTVSEGLNLVMKEFDVSISMGLRLQDEIPEYITHLVHVNELGITVSGPKETTLPQIRQENASVLEKHASNARMHKAAVHKPLTLEHVDDPIIEFDNAHVAYKGHFILKNFSWKVARGSRWRILGENGSGKTTILSLITADHPQSWRSVLSVNGTLRKSGSGQTYFGINNAIGMTSPELHAVVPYRMTMQEVILNGLIPNIGNMNFAMKFKDKLLSPFAKELLERFSEYVEPNKDVLFGELSTSLQKLALFLRAAIKKPELLILDEAFSCMDDEMLVIKCHQYIEAAMAETTVLTIGHIDWETPYHDKVLKLVGDESRSYEFYEVD